MRRFFFASLAGALCLGVATAAADEQPRPVPSLDLRTFRPSTDPAAGLYLEPASSPEKVQWNIGLYGSYVHRPITLRDSLTNEIAFDVLRHQLTGDLVTSIGLFGRVAVGLAMPVVVYQAGDMPTPASMNVLGSTEIPTRALGDLAITGKVTIVKPTAGDLGGFALALHERFTVPTGDPQSFLGEGSVTSATRVLAEYRLVAVGIHAAVGVKVRGEVERFACRDLPAGDFDECETRFGHDLPFGLGVSLKPQALGVDRVGRWTLFVESHGHLPIAPIAPFGNRRVAALELGLGARCAIGDFSILAGVESGVFGGLGTGPIRATLSIGWAPQSHDKDGDGIGDEHDQCPSLAEDKDGFEDNDGCPDGDNDDDGVPDNEDRCPTQKEDEDGVNDEDGCPEPDAIIPDEPEEAPAPEGA
jgi:OmpA-OmpF porin, OOP family